MTLRGDINVVFKGHAHELAEGDVAVRRPPLAVDLVVCCLWGSGRMSLSGI